LGYFNGAVEISHLDRAYQGNEWRKRYPLGTITKARILMVEQTTKTIYSTLRPHLMKMASLLELPEIGDFLDDAKVLLVGSKDN